MPLQTVSGKSFKPQHTAAASLQLTSGAAAMWPNWVDSSGLRAKGASGGLDVMFGSMTGLKGRSKAQLLGAFENKAFTRQKLCFTVSNSASAWFCAVLAFISDTAHTALQLQSSHARAVGCPWN